MTENFLETLTETISPDIIGKMSGLLGESEGTVTKGVASALPTLLSSVISKSSSEEGAQGMLDFMSSNGHDGSMLDNLSGMFSPKGSVGLMDQGSGIVNMLMGNNSGGVLSLLSKFTGLGGSSSNGIMKMLAPIVMGFIGKKVLSGGLNAGSLMSLLGDQSGFLKGLLPKGMGNVLGLAGNLGGMLEGGLGAVTGAASNIVSGAGDAVSGAGNLVSGAAGSVVSGAGSVVSGAGNMAKSTVSGAGNAAKSVVSGASGLAGSAMDKGKASTGRLWPWIVGIAVLLIAAYLIKGCGGTGIDAIDNVADKTTGIVEDAASKTTGAVANVADKTGDVIGDVAANAGDAVKSIGSFVSEATLTTLGAIKFATGSAGEQFYDWIKTGGEGEKAFAFKYLNFQTGKAVLSDTGKTELDNFSLILTEVKDIKVQISGHTDNTGDAAANVSLSQARADAIKAYLMTKGIVDGRIVSKGFGAAHPLVSNDTAEGRAQNRRSEVSVIHNN